MEWKDVPEYEDYWSISEDGRIWSKVSKRELKTHLDPSGYPVFMGTCKGKPVPIRLHRLVAQLWVPNPDNKPIVNHKDGVKANIHHTNLEWSTYAENSNHAINSGLTKKKLTREIVEYCRQVHIPYHKEFSAAALARRFDVTKLTMSKAISGETWK